MKAKTASMILKAHLEGMPSNTSAKILLEAVRLAESKGLKGPFTIEKIAAIDSVQGLDPFPSIEESPDFPSHDGLGPDTSNFEKAESGFVIPKDLANKVREWGPKDGFSNDVAELALVGKRVSEKLIKETIKELEAQFHDDVFEGNMSPHENEHFEQEAIANKLRDIIGFHETVNDGMEEIKPQDDINF